MNPAMNQWGYVAVEGYGMLNAAYISKAEF